MFLKRAVVRPRQRSHGTNICFSEFFGCSKCFIAQIRNFSLYVSVLRHRSRRLHAEELFYQCISERSLSVRTDKFCITLIIRNWKTYGTLHFVLFSYVWTAETQICLGFLPETCARSADSADFRPAWRFFGLPLLSDTNPPLLFLPGPLAHCLFAQGHLTAAAAAAHPDKCRAVQVAKAASCRHDTWCPSICFWGFKSGHSGHECHKLTRSWISIFEKQRYLCCHIHGER